MEFRIQETATGLFEIIQTQPVVVGTFAEKDMACKVMSFLVKDALDHPQAETAALPVLEELAANEEPADWTEEELSAAFGLVGKGEKLKTVADQFGKSWTVLRGKWGAEKKRRAAMPNTIPAPSVNLPVPVADQEPPVAKVSKAIAELAEQPECRLCGRKFEPTPDRLDLCARCSHGA